MKQDEKEDTIRNDYNEDTLSLKMFVAKTKEHYRYLKSKWPIILIFLVIGIIAGVFFAIKRKPLYMAITTFTIEQSSQAPSGIAGLASQLGLNLGSNKGSIFDGYNITAFFRSRLMIQKALLTPAPFGNSTDLLVNRYIGFNNYRAGWKDDPKLKNLTFKANEPLNRVQDSVLELFYNSIIKSQLYIDKMDDKKLNNIYVLSVTCTDELFSKEFSDILTKNVVNFYTQTQISKTTRTIAMLQHQVDSVRGRLNQSLTGVASSIDNTPNANPYRKVLTVTSQDKSVQAEIDRSALVQLSASLQGAKISLNQDTPLIDIIDAPILPLDILKTTKLKGGVVGGFLFTVLGIFILTVKRKTY